MAEENNQQTPEKEVEKAQEATVLEKTVEKPVQVKQEAPKEKVVEVEVEEEIEIPKNLEKLVKDIEDMKVSDLAILVKVLEKKFGVSAAAAAPVAVAAGEAPAEEKSFFNISLTGVGDKKIEVIKAIRDITQRGLKESKDLVDEAASGPQVVKEKVKKEEAELIKKKLESAGATVEMK
ncbi:MAG: 50S ribosomal protein L7/L12 [Candidatus Pacebacteria bacterium]|nr:50S ribosomal protein L7/L12 [Candidatus Paceibacterota bacterium]